MTATSHADMALIPGGEFAMGSDRHYAEERPVHTVSVDPFWIERHPVTNEQFSHTLGAVMHRPVVTTVPEFAVKLMFGEMGEETLLSGQRVVPRRLLDSGFTFDFPELEGALRHELGK